MQPQQHEHYAPSTEPKAPGPPEHLVYGANQPIRDVYDAPVPQMPALPPPGPAPMYGQAIGEIPQEGAHTLGLSLLAIAGGIAVGAKTGGLPGAAAGSLFAGAAVNALRAVAYFKEGTDEDDREGRVSALYGVIGAVGGGVLWSRYVQGGDTFAENPDEDVLLEEEEDVEVIPNTPCGIRPAGP
jgi:hypothetical protein